MVYVEVSSPVLPSWCHRSRLPLDPNLDQVIGQQNYLENLWKLCNVEGPYAFHSEYCIFRKSQVIIPLAIMPSDIGIHMFLY